MNHPSFAARASRIVALAIACFATAAAAEPHAHGAGRLEVVVDGSHFAVTLDMPAESAVGFERPPRTAAEKLAVEGMLKVFRDGPTLFKPTPAAECRLTTADLATPFSPATEAKPRDGAEAQGGDHGDIEATYVFDCAKPDKLKSLETTIFTRFKRLYRLDVERAGPGGQGAGRLTPKQPTLNW